MGIHEPISPAGIQAYAKSLLTGVSLEGLSWTDVRLAALLEPIRFWGPTPELALKALMQDPPPAYAVRATPLIERIEQLLSMNCSEELQDVANAIPWDSMNRDSDRNRQIFTDRFSSGDEGEGWLRAIAPRYELTHERVRQVVQMGQHQLMNAGVWMPASDRALGLIQAQGPIRLDRLSLWPDLVRTLGSMVSVPALLRLRRAVSPLGDGGVMVQREPRVGGLQIAATEDQRRKMLALMSLLVKCAREHVMAVIDPEDPKSAFYGLDPSMLQVLRWVPGVVDAGADWFVLPHGKDSHLAGQIRKALCVAPEGHWVSIPRLEEALKRSQSYAAAPLPITVLYRACQEIPEIRLCDHGAQVRGDRAALRAAVLSEHERPIVEHLLSQGGVSSFFRLNEVLKEIGFSGANGPTMSYAPFLYSPARGIYQLLGWSPTQEAIEQAKAGLAEAAGRRQGKRRAKPVTSAALGQDPIRFTTVLRGSMFNTGRVPVPATFSEWMQACGHRKFSCPQLPELILGSSFEQSGQVRLRRLTELAAHLGMAQGDSVEVTISKAGSVHLAKASS